MKYFNRQEAEKHAEMRYSNLDAYGKILAKRAGFVYGAEWMADKITHQERESPDSYREALEALLNELPENRPLYRDSGLWQVRSDDMEDVICQQQVNETFLEFIDRYQNDSARAALGEKEVRG